MNGQFVTGYVNCPEDAEKLKGLINETVSKVYARSPQLSITYSYPTQGDGRKSPYVPKNIIVNGRTMIFEWDNGKKTRVTCSKEDVFSVEAGYMAALTEYIFGSKKVYKKLWKVISQRVQVQKVDKGVNITTAEYQDKRKIKNQKKKDKKKDKKKKNVK